VGQPVTGYVGELDIEVVVVVVSSVVVRLVGRTGGCGIALDSDVVVIVAVVVDEGVERAGQFTLPHARSVGQQPPPNVAGQERNPEEQVKGSVAEDVTVMVFVIVET